MGRRTALGTSALVLGANLPDVDVLSYLGGPLADLEWRRGWSHGILALVVLPVLLTGSLILIHRIRPVRRAAAHSTPDTLQLLLLSAIAIISHPVLDTLNTYGLRWLMPFSGRWFYGDALFIVDPWVWLMLGVGLLSARRQRANPGSSHRIARLTLAAFLVYAGLMWISGAAARGIIASTLQSSGDPPRTIMASPRPVTVLSRSWVAEKDEDYLVGTFHWLRQPRVQPSIQAFPRGRPSHPAFAVAESTLVFRRFLGWARFPTFGVERAGDSEYLVHVVDLRYAREPAENFGTLTVPVTLR